LPNTIDLLDESAIHPVNGGHPARRRFEMSLFIAFPQLAAGLGALFLLLYGLCRRRSSAVAGIAWLVYAGYETGMRLRWFCSGECNIRVDLLLIYPVLLVISVVPIISFVRWLVLRG
jgi:hypothetical protein